MDKAIIASILPQGCLLCDMFLHNFVSSPFTAHERSPNIFALSCLPYHTAVFPSDFALTNLLNGLDRRINV